MVSSVRKIGVGLCIGMILAFVTGCGAGGASGGEGSRERVQVGGDRVEAFSIVPVGGSPETYGPSPRDAGRISESQVVFENGLGLDAWVEDLVESAGNEEQTVVELSEGLATIEGGEHEEGEQGAEEPEEEGEHAHEHAEGNPHLWLDVTNPEGAEEYEANAGEYLAELEELDGYIRERAEGIPEERRKLVTFHDAFPYFAEAYGFELVGVVLENPEAEPGSREVAEVVLAIEEEGVPVVFTEPQFNAGLANTVAQEAGVEVRELYTDTLVDDEAGNTYEAMMRTNIDRISEALG